MNNPKAEAKWMIRKYGFRIASNRVNLSFEYFVNQVRLEESKLRFWEEVRDEIELLGETG